MGSKPNIIEPLAPRSTKQQVAAFLNVRPWPVDRFRRDDKCFPQPAGFPTARRAKHIESEHKTRVIAEARRLAGLAEVDWKYQVDHGSAERLGIEPKELEQYVKAAINDRKKAAQELERGADKQRQAAEDAEEKERKDEERRRVAAERAKRAEQKKRDDERRGAARKANEKRKTFANITRLPVARHEKELARLARRLGEDVAALREEFAEFLGVGSEPAETTEPWPEPVNIAVVLQELGDKISRYVVMQEHQLIAAQLWTAHTWLYDYQVPVHSPILERKLERSNRLSIISPRAFSPTFVSAPKGSRKPAGTTDARVQCGRAANTGPICRKRRSRYKRRQMSHAPDSQRQPFRHRSNFAASRC
jgi:hypothetical protein